MQPSVANLAETVRQLKQQQLAYVCHSQEGGDTADLANIAESEVSACIQ